MATLQVQTTAGRGEVWIELSGLDRMSSAHLEGETLKMLQVWGDAVSTAAVGDPIQEGVVHGTNGFNTPQALTVEWCAHQLKHMADALDISNNRW
jgi:hypothetical protein